MKRKPRERIMWAVLSKPWFDNAAPTWGFVSQLIRQLKRQGT